MNRAKRQSRESEKSAKGRVPRLRFPEFRDAGEWEEKRACSLFVNRTEGGEEGLPIYSVTMNNGMIKRSLMEREFDDIEKPESNRKVYKDDIAYNMMRMWQGASGVAIEDCMVSPAYVILAPVESIFSPFFGYLFKLPGFLRLLTSHSQGLTSDRLRLYYKDFAHIHMPHPSFREQQKIADCLSSLDELIAAHVKKLEILKWYKKGLMQKLFPAEGETLPRLRFPEFRDAGEWEEDRLGKVYSFKSTNTFSRELLNYKNGSALNIHYGDIHMKFPTLFDINNESVPYINPDQETPHISEDSYCIEGDVIFADASEDEEDVGKCIEIVKLSGQKLVSGLHTLLARQIYRKMVIGFGGYLFKSSNTRVQIQKESQGTKVFSISAKRLSNITICFPKIEREQQKIADCLSSLDALIAAYSKKIDALKQHKKALMQQLFPQAVEALP